MPNVTLPEAGQPAPGFTARAEDGAIVRLADFHGEWVILFFYPKDDTSG